MTDSSILLKVDLYGTLVFAKVLLCLGRSSREIQHALSDEKQITFFLVQNDIAIPVHLIFFRVYSSQWAVFFEMCGQKDISSLTFQFHF